MLSTLCRKQVFQSLGWSQRNLARELRLTRSPFTPRQATRSLTNNYHARWNAITPSLAASRFGLKSSEKISFWSARRFASTVLDSQTEEAAASEAVEAQLSQEEMEMIIERVNEVWGCPEREPDGWSSDWENWPYLLTYYWLSPYYLRLPQIDMIVNIKHHVDGQTRPILYSTQSRGLIFNIVEDPERYFLLDGEDNNLFLFEDVNSEEALLDLLESDADSILSKMVLIEPHPEGEAALQRIFARDETVIDVLEKEFLDYRPVATTPEQEGVAPMPAKMTEEQELVLLDSMKQDAAEWNRLYATQGEDVEVVKDTMEEMLEGPIPIGKIVDQALDEIRQGQKLPAQDLDAVAKRHGLKGKEDGINISEEEAEAAEKALEKEAARIVKDSKGKYT